MIRRFGTPPRPDQTYGPRPGAYVVLLRGAEMLVTEEDRSAVGFAPEIQLPGGGIDPGESPVPALHREVLEETGWRMATPRRLGAYRRFIYMPEYEKWAEKICTIYLARPTICLGPPTEAGHRAIWMPAEIALARLANTGDRVFAAQALGVALGMMKLQ
ncbi:NUDIX hydrolase [Cognatishimia sp. SS12]|uniref:NUDIX hydrolase n=1 Tax=Cognatishimia sp. SS12 TaxID=2979465 RepID=UPI00232AEDDB|nr:NUDIX hydrolase [Cognatishimia sp. SS12]MDC0737718.1 NUDIX hydrolase [Cognatishimia sp. SS12]